MYTYKNEKFYDTNYEQSNFKLYKSEKYTKQPCDNSQGFICFYPTIDNYVFVHNGETYRLK